MIKEHHNIDHMFEVCAGTKLADETWDAKFKVLSEVIERHLKEEEDKFFDIANKEVPDDVLEKQRKTFEDKQRELADKYRPDTMAISLQ